jgi:hypothetical protein
MTNIAYWTFVVALIAFGVVGILSIGMPFLLLGVLLAALSGQRRRPVVFWPPVAGLLAFFAAFIVTAPLGCTVSASGSAPSTTRCTNIIGIDYSGGGRYNPSPAPALLIGLVVAVATALADRRLLARKPT